jgi:hypothetical protein
MVGGWLRLMMRNNCWIPVICALSMGGFLQTARDALVFFPDGGLTQIQIIHQPPRNATTPVTYSFRASQV